MPIRVSTRVEEAWYVDPELLAGDGEEKAQPVELEIDSDGPLPRDMTVALGEGDLEEVQGGLTGDDDVARHYREVSLKGALLVNEAPFDEEASWTERVFGRLRGRVPTLGEDRPSASRPPPTPRTHVDEGGATTRASSGSAPRASALSSLVRVFEPGRVPPILLAAISFFAGVITTLLGVLLAL